jgi:hypothetical protein
VCESREEGSFGRHATQRIASQHAKLQQATSRNLGLSQDSVTSWVQHHSIIADILISDLLRLSPRSFQALQNPKEGRSIGRREIACHQLHSRRSRANCFGVILDRCLLRGLPEKIYILKGPFFGVARRNRQVDQTSSSTS